MDSIFDGRNNTNHLFPNSVGKILNNGLGIKLIVSIRHSTFIFVSQIVVFRSNILDLSIFLCDIITED